jgi:alpha-L-arabinofuranosidase
MMLQRLGFAVLIPTIFASWGTLFADTPSTNTTATMAVDVDHPGITVSPTLYGIFYEEINHAGDGGLYAEMVRNRSFEDTDKPDYWTLVTADGGKGEMAIETDRPMSEKNPHSLRLTIDEIGDGRVGVANEGYYGIAVAKDEVYDLSLFARAVEGYGGKLCVSLESADGKSIYAQIFFAKLTSGWKNYQAALTSQANDPNARLVISGAKPGTIWLDMVSLFPRKTWPKKPAGMRFDLADMLDNLHPSFLRFPGGCWVEGEEMKFASRWKRTIGDVSERWTQWNLWRYHSTNALGYLEYLELSESLGAEPMFVINVGMSHKEIVPMEKMGEYVQDALDAIEYANGPAESKWGSLRAKHGHPAPFNMKLMEIGNENGGPAYDERFALFYDAIKAKYPQMQLISNEPVKKRTPDVVDEHYYNTPEVFINQAEHYDNYDRKGPKIFVGEYAVTQNGGMGNLRAAVGEAAFMTGLERNADVVALAAYAPLFGRMVHRAWSPDLINFDNYRSYGLPSYYVQKMFSENRGDVVLPTTIDVPENSGDSPHGAVGVGTWLTQAEFKDVEVSNGEKTLNLNNFSNGDGGWKPLQGEWTVKEGALRQMSLAENCRNTAGDPRWTDYTLSLKARKIGGKEGFLILFHVQDDANFVWWNLGGWGNAEHGLEQSAGGSKLALGRHVPGSIESGRWYDIRIEVQSKNIKCYLDGKLIHDAEIAAPKPLYAVSGLTKNKDEVIVKVVNAAAAAYNVELNLSGAKSVEPALTRILLMSDKATDENSLDQPTKVAPMTEQLPIAGSKARVRFPGNSVSVLRLKIKP